MKLQKYQEFILERQENFILDLLNESVFVMSDDMTKIFQDIIDGLEDDPSNPTYKIAKIFINLDLMDVDFNMSYFDVTDDNNTIKFVDADKGDKLRDDEGYTVKDVIQKTKGNSIRIGRLVRKVIDMWNKRVADKGLKLFAKFSDKEIENFVNAYKAQYDFDNNIMDNFKLVSGYDITELYNCGHYYGDMAGTLGSSCMKDVDASYFDIYAESPSVQMLVLMSPNKDIMGRALVWKLIKETCGSEYFMDRIYTSRDSDVDLFIKYARDNKWIYKVKQNYSTIDFMCPGDDYNNAKNVKLISNVVSLPASEHPDFPYLDTMKYYYWQSGMISNSNYLRSGDVDRHAGYYIELTDTDGGATCDSCYGEVKDCEECGGDGRIDCAECYGDGQNDCPDCDNDPDCETCYGDGVVSCEECGGDGRIDCETCDGDGGVECEQCGGYAHQLNWGY